ncbi:MAG TPA: response regulator, partial [Gammaproteobacteria bacterium]|nr:response regulator [Gammaproteobacteria bacterium]
AGADAGPEDFDPLELDRFSRMQELSRALSESTNDLVSIQNLLDNLTRESETLLLQQSRVNTELQDGLMRTRMVPFANLVPRMRRIVRQTCHELGKKAQLKVLGARGEMDRTVLERVTAPLEHMLRNAVAHGVEEPEVRRAAGKSEEGTITVALSREGADVVIRVSDDGGGIPLEAVRRKAIAQGLMPADAPLSDREVMQFILEAGFSTSEKVTQIAGRGVGMDVVTSEIKQLGGALEIESSVATGTTFTIRLPFTLAINQALLCQVGEDVYAIPLTSIEGVVRMTHEELERCFANPQASYYDYAGQRYEVRGLSSLLGIGEPQLPGRGGRAPIILVQTGDHRLAIQVDTLLGNREIVVKSVGPQISMVPGIYGATILADGRVVLILDVSSLVRLHITAPIEQEPASVVAPLDADGRQKITVMVVDDSITMRKVATRLLERGGMAVVTAKDGVDAVARLQETIPDAMLLDIEMPRMDGYELATHMRNDERLRHVPIIMITSRTSEKHRERAFEIGVNRYLGKPYQEAELLANLQEVLEETGVEV